MRTTSKNVIIWPTACMNEAASSVDRKALCRRFRASNSSSSWRRFAHLTSVATPPASPASSTAESYTANAASSVVTAPKSSSAAPDITSSILSVAGPNVKSASASQFPSKGAQLPQPPLLSHSHSLRQLSLLRSASQKACRGEVSGFPTQF